MFIILSMFCKYGSGLVENRKLSSGGTDTISQGNILKKEIKMNITKAKGTTVQIPKYLLLFYKRFYKRKLFI